MKIEEKEILELIRVLSDETINKYDRLLIVQEKITGWGIHSIHGIGIVFDSEKDEYFEGESK